MEESQDSLPRHVSSKDRQFQDCENCREYYNYLVKVYGVEAAQKRQKKCSKHDEKRIQMETPSGFWKPNFTDSPVETQM